MKIPKHAWMVRAGNDNILIETLEDKQAIAIAWMAMNDLSKLKTRDDFKTRYTTAYPDDSMGRVPVNAGQIFRFVKQIQIGDYLLTYDNSAREYIIGLVTSDYLYDISLFDNYPHIRKVNWLKRVSRDEFSDNAKNSLGSIMTVFNLDSYIEEIHTFASGESKPPQVIEEAEETPAFIDNVQAQADELIADIISNLGPYEFQNLVAGVLRSMGFRAKSVPPGPDGGIDVIAHPDALGLEAPRIKVQVKHKTSKASGPEMRSFIGAMRNGDRGIFVSTGGFTPDAKAGAVNAPSPITILDRDGFIDLMLETYDDLEPEFRAMIPLRKLWIPI